VFESEGAHHGGHSTRAYSGGLGVSRGRALVGC